jgi:S-formylglutathione hydrolase FrmB
VSRRALLVGAAGGAILMGSGAAAADYEINRHPRWRTMVFGCGETPPIPHSDYAITTGTYPSAAMRTDMPWLVALPRAVSPVLTRRSKRIPLVVALPGADAALSHVVDAIGLPGWATASGAGPMAIVCPGGAGHSYYHPRADGTNSFAWVTDEFIPMIEQRFPIGGTRARRAVYGNSMGGFGALLVAAERPHLVCAAVASSPAVFLTYDAAVTGHPETFDSAADWRHWGLWRHTRALDGMPVRIDCGDADPFAPAARQLLSRIPGSTGGISQGCHDDAFWRRSAPAQVRFLTEHLAA